MLDLIIVGSGPAGLSAAVYGKRAGLDLVVMEANPMSGGQVLNTYEVDNYLGLPGMNGFDMGMAFREHCDKLGVEFKEECVSSIEKIEERFVVETDVATYESKTVIVATGAHHAHLEVPGEEELSGMGVSYCATCDGAFFKGKVVAVVGGGDVALEDAIYLARGCSKVYLIHRRDTFRGAKVLQQECEKLENIEILYNSSVKEILGNNKVEAIILQNNVTNEQQKLELDGVFIAVGIHPETEMLTTVNILDEQGYCLAGEDCKTSVEGLFVAGDIRKKPIRQIVTAVADGANAATSAANFCNK